MQIGFCGRVLLNAFNEIEWGEAHGDNNLKQMGESIIESFKQNGFTPAGYFYDFVNFNEGMPKTLSTLSDSRARLYMPYCIISSTSASTDASIRIGRRRCAPCSTTL